MTSTSNPTKKHLFIPDCQVRPNVPLSHLSALGNYIVEKQPDVIICAGDFADMHSLSSYDRATGKAEGARYAEDIDAADEAMLALLRPIYKAKKYRPRMVLTLGNHEERIVRYANANPSLIGKVSYDDLPYSSWEVYDYLQPVVIDGISYCHFFPRNAQGRITQTKRGAPSARLQVLRELQSCTSGHLQGVDYYVHQTGDRRFHGLMAGSFYQHEEEYLSPQGTAYWRGVIVKHEVHDGQYDPCFISLDYLLNKYL